MNPSKWRMSLLVGAAATLLLTPPAAAADPSPAPQQPNGHAHAVPPTGGGRQDTSEARAQAPSGYPIRGIDVSNHQATVNWPTVARAGTRFAYAKATEGDYFTDRYYAGNYANAKNAGVYIGAYHYARPDQSSGKQQADYFLDRAGYVADGRTLPPMLDIEWPWSGSGSAYPCYGLTPAQMSTWIRAFVNQIKARTNQPTMIYTNTYWWNPCTGSDTSFSNLPLFIANYSATSSPVLPGGWTRWTLWQYSSSGSLPGDQNVFNGNASDLAALASGKQFVQVATGAAYQTGAGSQHVFGRGSDGRLHQWYWSAATGVRNQNWGYLMVGTPVAAVIGNSQHVWARGSDNRLKHWYWTPTTGILVQDWGGSIAGDPTVFVRSGGEQHVFARGVNGRLQAWYWAPGSRNIVNQDWGGNAAGGVSAVFDPASGTQHIFGNGSDGRLKHWYWSGVSGGVRFQNWGGSATAAPSAFVTAGGQQHVFARNSAGRLSHWYWGPTTGGVRNQDWGGDIAGAATAMTSAADVQHVFARTRGGRLQHWFWSPASGGWHTQSWGGDAAGDPSAFLAGDAQHVFARSRGGHQYHWYWTPTAGGPHVQDWGGQLG